MPTFPISRIRQGTRLGGYELYAVDRGQLVWARIDSRATPDDLVSCLIQERLISTAQGGIVSMNGSIWSLDMNCFTARLALKSAHDGTVEK